MGSLWALWKRSHIYRRSEVRTTNQEHQMRRTLYPLRHLAYVGSELHYNNSLEFIVNQQLTIYFWILEWICLVFDGYRLFILQKLFIIRIGSCPTLISRVVDTSPMGLLKFEKSSKNKYWYFNTHCLFSVKKVAPKSKAIFLRDLV